MQIKIILDDSEVCAMVNKMRRQTYNRKKIKDAGAKIMKAYEQFERIKKKDEPSPGQVTIDQLIKTFGGKVVK